MKPLSLTALLAALLISSTVPAATLQVKVDGVASAKGTLRIAVCDQASFLKKCARGALVPAKAGSVTVDVPDLPSGAWAVMAYHDENGNRKLDRNAMGIPTEGFGFSNGATARSGPPAFAKTAVTVGATTAVAAISLQY